MGLFKRSLFGGYNKKQTEAEFAKLKEQYEKEISELKKDLDVKKEEYSALKEHSDKLEEEQSYAPQTLIYVKEKADSIVREAKEEYGRNLAAYNEERELLEGQISDMRNYLLEALNQAVEAADKMSTQLKGQLTYLMEHNFETRMLEASSDPWQDADKAMEERLETAAAAADAAEKTGQSADEVIADIFERCIEEIKAERAEDSAPDAGAGETPADGDSGELEDMINELGADIGLEGTETPAISISGQDGDYLKGLIDELIDE